MRKTGAPGTRPSQTPGRRHRVRQALGLALLAAALVATALTVRWEFTQFTDEQPGDMPLLPADAQERANAHTFGEEKLKLARPFRVLGYRSAATLTDTYGTENVSPRKGGRFVLVWTECQCKGRLDDWYSPGDRLRDGRGRVWEDVETLYGDFTEYGAAKEGGELDELKPDAQGWYRVVNVFEVPADAEDFELVVSSVLRDGEFSGARWPLEELAAAPGR